MWYTCICVLTLAVAVNAQAPTIRNDEGIANAGYTNSKTINFRASGTKAGFPKISCRLDSQGASTCQDPQTYTGLTDGKHTLVVQFALSNGQVDTSAQTVFTWTVDTIAPTLVFTRLPFDVNKPKTNAATITFFFGVQSSLDNQGGITFTCSMKRATEPTPFITEDCTTTKSVTYFGLGVSNQDLNYNFTVTAVDQAKNMKTLTSNFAVDEKKPIVWMPTLGSSFLSLPPRYTNKTTASFTFTTDEPGQVDFTCRRDGSGLFTACPTKPYTGLAQGEHTLQIQVQDWAGNIQTLMNVRRPVNYTNAFGVNSTTSVFQWRVDTTPPPKPQIAVKPKLQTNTKMPQFQFTVAGTQIGGLSYSCQLALPGTLPISFSCFQTTDVASAASQVQGVPATGLLEGPYTMQVNAIDAAGNYGASQRYDFTVDLEAPNVVLDSTTPNTPNGETTNSPSMTFAFHSIDKFPERTDAIGHYTTVIRNPCPLYNCTMQCSLDSAPLTPCVSPITYTSLTAVGRVERHTFQVVATDNATNVGMGPDELQYSWSIDRIPPTTTFTQTPSKAIAIDSATFEWTTTEPAARPPQFFCSLDNGAQFNCTPVPTAGRYRWTLQNLTHSFNHIFAVVAVDFYGNAAPAITYAWQVDLHPPMVTFNPSTWATQGVRLGNPIVLQNGSYSNIVFVTFAFATEPGSTMECQIDTLPWIGCMSGYRVSSLKDGEHTFRVRATDPVGHVTMAWDQPYWTWITDTVGPLVTYSKFPKRFTNKLNSTFWAMSNEAQSTYQCEYRSKQFQSGSTSWIPCLSAPFLATVSNNVMMLTLQQYIFSQTGTQINFVGDHTFLVRAVDRAGNVGPGKPWLFTVDLTPPMIVISSENHKQPRAIYSLDFPWSPNNYAEFRFQASEVVTYSCIVTPNVSWVNPIPCSAPGITINKIDKFDTYMFKVQATDRAGNTDPVTSAKTYMWTDAPSPPETKVLSGPQYYVNRWNNLNFRISTPVPRVRAECAVDRLHPNKTVRFAGVWQPCVNRSSTMSSPASVSYTADLLDMLNASVAMLSTPDGFYNFKTRIIDVFNRTSKTAAFEFVIDTIPPQTALEGTTPYATANSYISFTYFTDNPDYLHERFECQLKLQDSRSQMYTQCTTATYPCTWASCGTSQNFLNTISGLSTKGTYQFSVRAIDKAGNIDQSPVVTTFIYNPNAPKILTTGVKPSKYVSINDSMTFAFTGDEGTQYSCLFARSDWPNNDQMNTPCISPVTFKPSPVAVQRNGSTARFVLTGTDQFTGLSTSITYITILYNTTDLATRIMKAQERATPEVCTNNNQLFFILFIVFAGLTIVIVVVMVFLILRKMENKGLQRNPGASAMGRKESRTPLTSFSNPQFSELQET
ncbi:uncharacterized protein LOC135821172 [Sycon ciliatum]|uniref:uncharacterized protein LOC135821172 n=1 Tax=Sycon ciliatum TaxID=27933 RepID=UPI0031F6E727